MARQAANKSRKRLNGFAGLTWQVDLDPRCGISIDGSNNVTAWADSGTSQGICYKTTANAPVLTTPANGINGISVLQFTGAEVLQLTSNLVLHGLTNFTMFFVLKPTTLTGLRIAFRSSTSASSNGVGPGVNVAGNGKREVWMSGSSTCEDGAAVATPEIWCLQRDATTMTLYVNKVAQTINNSTAAPVAPTGGGALIGGFAVASPAFIGLIGNILVANSFLNSTDRDAVTDELNRIYAIY